MKRTIPLIIIAAITSFSILLSSCSYQNEKVAKASAGNQIDVSSKKTFKLNLDKIKKKYANVKIKSIKNVGNECVLVESQQNNCANKFDIYNLKTGDMDYLPTMPEFVTLEKIENENYFIFLSSGKNSESSFANFPDIIKCIRVKNDIKKDDDFIALREDKYFDLDYSIQSGNKKEEVMADLNVTYDGLEVLFKPIKGKKTEFYADSADIPPVKTSYDKELKQFIFEIGADQIDKGLIKDKRVKLNENQYMSGYKITQMDNNIYLAIDVKENTKTYMVKIKRLPNGLPYFSVAFAEKQ